MKKEPAVAKKNAAAVELGRRGGLKKVPKGFARISKKKRREIARKAAEARWGGRGRKNG
jgi:hypothetical protein